MKLHANILQLPPSGMVKIPDHEPDQHQKWNVLLLKHPNP